jgi:hypothetical protein
MGEDDQLGAMNLVGPQQVRAAAALVRDGKVISLTLPYDQHGPQPGGLRSNPQLLNTATGTDHVAGAPEYFSGDFGYSDEMIIMGTQCGTQWDALSRIFHRSKMWNGYSAAEYASHLATRNGPALERPHGAACRSSICPATPRKPARQGRRQRTLANAANRRQSS